MNENNESFEKQPVETLEETGFEVQVEKTTIPTTVITVSHSICSIARSFPIVLV